MSLSTHLGLLGRKVGMMRVFTEDGEAIPVTVIDVSNNRVSQVINQETDGYTALQLTYGKRRASRVLKPQAGHLAKAGVEAGEDGRLLLAAGYLVLLRHAHRDGAALDCVSF